MRCSADLEANTTRALSMTRDLAEQGAHIICLPELFRSRYFCQTEDAAHFSAAEPVPGPTTDAFLDLAAQYDTTILVSLFERRTAGVYHNTLAVLDGKRGYIGKYRKMHIPDDPRYYEKFYFTPGDLGFKAFQTPEACIGTLVCWDQWFPEAARLTALQGAHILFYPTAIGWHPEERDSHGEQQHAAWETMQRSHAIANGCFVVAVNRTGFEPTGQPETHTEGIEFWGQSFVAAPDGTVLFRGPSNEETTAIVDIDLGDIELLRIGWPFFRDRRIDAYPELTRRFIDPQ